MHPQSRRCPTCTGYIFDPSAGVCQACAVKAREEFDRDERKLRLYLAFDQWLFDHDRAAD